MEKIREVLKIIEENTCPDCGHFLHNAGDCYWHDGTCEEASCELEHWCKCSTDRYMILQNKILELTDLTPKRLKQNDKEL